MSLVNENSEQHGAGVHNDSAPVVSACECAGNCGHQHGYTADKDAYLKRLRRIEGQVRGIQRMVSEDVYCIDVLTQISAISSALRGVSLQLLEDHVRHCVVGAANEARDTGNAQVLEDKLAEATAAIGRLVRS